MRNALMSPLPPADNAQRRSDPGCTAVYNSCMGCSHPCHDMWPPTGSPARLAGPDFRVLCRKGRKAAQQYYRVYQELIPISQLVRELAAVMQEFTQQGGVRPFGALCRFRCSHGLAIHKFVVCSRWRRCWQPLTALKWWVKVAAVQACIRLIARRSIKVGRSFLVAGYFYLQAFHCSSLALTTSGRSSTKSIPLAAISHGRFDTPVLRACIPCA